MQRRGSERGQCSCWDVQKSLLDDCVGDLCLTLAIAFAQMVMELIMRCEVNKTGSTLRITGHC